MWNGGCDDRCFVMDVIGGCDDMFCDGCDDMFYDGCGMVDVMTDVL